MGHGREVRGGAVIAFPPKRSLDGTPTVVGSRRAEGLGWASLTAFHSVTTCHWRFERIISIVSAGGGEWMFTRTLLTSCRPTTRGQELISQFVYKSFIVCIMRMSL